MAGPRRRGEELETSEPSEPISHRSEREEDNGRELRQLRERRRNSLNGAVRVIGVIRCRNISFAKIDERSRQGKLGASFRKRVISPYGFSPLSAGRTRPLSSIVLASNRRVFIDPPAGVSVKDFKLSLPSLLLSSRTAVTVLPKAIFLCTGR